MFPHWLTETRVGVTLVPQTSTDGAAAVDGGGRARRATRFTGTSSTYCRRGQGVTRAASLVAVVMYVVPGEEERDAPTPVCMKNGSGG